MTKKELERYFRLQHEIKKQRRRLERYQKIQAVGTVGDTVKDYRTGKGVPVKIEGFPEEVYDSGAIIKELEESIRESIQESKKEVLRIEKYVKSIEDPLLREIMRCRFMECKGWREVGKENFISGDHARKMVRIYFQEKKKDDRS